MNNTSREENFILLARIIANFADEYDDLKKRIENVRKIRDKMSLICTHEILLYPLIIRNKVSSYCICCGKEITITEENKSKFNLIDLKKILDEFDIELDENGYNIFYSTVHKELITYFREIVSLDKDLTIPEIKGLLEDKVRDILKDNYTKDKFYLRKRKGK